MEEEKRRIRVLCPSNLILCRNEAGIRWLVGSSAFFPPFTILSSFRSLHSQPNDDPFSPDFIKEADDIRSLLLRGFDIIGAIFVSNQNWEENALKAAEASCKMRKVLYGAHGDAVMIGAAADLVTGNIQFFVYGPGKSTKLEAVNTIIYEDNPQKFVWETGCLLRCELAMRLPIYVPTDRISEAGEIFSSAVDATAATFKDPSAVYIVEGSNKESEEVLQPVVLHHNELDFKTDLLEAEIIVDAAKGNDTNPISCSHFFQKDSPYSAFTAGKNADPIQVTILFNRSRNAAKSAAPVAEYFPVSEPSRLLVISFKLDVLTYVSKSFPVASAVSKLIFPGLVDQLTAMKKAIVPSLSSQHPQLCPYHFFPPGFLHPITTIYDLSYGEMEMRQVEIRRSLHLRLGLPLDRPLFLIANALNYADTKGATGNSLLRNGSQPLKDVHTEIPRSGVSGGIVSLVQGSYEYYHYLQYGYDDIGWGCSYRSLQTVISWFRLQHYTSIDVPSHREIQQALVEVGDKEPSFLGSREWIGAIELSFVLDKLLGVSCKIINVRSGSELPEKCRELALHFETQGTPVMIGGGVLAYTLLGVDYSETSGDCAFLILDPHYTGTDELKKIVNGGWCGWKKAIDSNGRNFFLHNKFYNLLLPQRPNMV